MEKRNIPFGCTKMCVLPDGKTLTELSVNAVAQVQTE
jgi:hypothetical protein